MSDVRERMQETAALVTATLPPGTGFVILAFDFGPPPGRMEYISNAQRGDIVKVMREWIAKTEKQFMSHESPFAPHWFEIGEEDRQMILRGLSIQALFCPGFNFCCEEIANKLGGAQMFEDFKKYLSDRIRPIAL